MSNRTQAAEWRNKFLAVYNETLPDFSDITSPEFGKAKSTKEESRKKAQELYDEFKVKQKAGLLDFSTGDMHVEDELFRLGVVISKGSGLRTRVGSPYNPETFNQENGLGDDYNGPYTDYPFRIKDNISDFLLVGTPLAEASRRVGIIGMDLEVDPKTLLDGDKSSYRQQSVITDQEKTTDIQSNAFTFLCFACTRNRKEFNKRFYKML